MKKLLFSCLMLSAVSFTANAQDAARNNNNNTVNANVTAAAPAASLSEMAARQTNDLTPAQAKAAEQKAEKNAKSLQSKLGLDERQYAAVLDAEKAYQTEVVKYPAGKIPSGHESNITWARNKQIKAVLTEAQAAKYDELQAKTK